MKSLFTLFLLIILVCLLALPHRAKASQFNVCVGAPERALVASDAVPYDTEQGAAVAAVLEAFRKPNSDFFEYGGVIVSDKVTHKYYYSSPVGGCGAGEVKYVYDPDWNRGRQLEALYHTHPAQTVKNFAPWFFSEGDIYNVTKRKGSLVTSYIGVYADQDGHRVVKKFEPDTDITVKIFYRGNPYYVGLGTLVEVL